jgi:hypothetical protein
MEQAFVLLGVVGLLVIVGLIVLGAVPGQPQANRFGEPPPPGLGFKKAPVDQIGKTFD